MQLELNTTEKRAAAIQNTLAAHKGMPGPKAEIAEGQLSAEQIRKNLVVDLKAATKEVDALRTSNKDRNAVDISWSEYIKEKWGISPSEDASGLKPFYAALGVNPAYHSMDMLTTTPDFGSEMRWLIPEVIREAVRLGLRTAPIYKKLLAAEQFVTQPTVYMPQINMSDAPVADLNEIETIPTGVLSFGQKTITLRKHGTGIKVSDEVNQFVPLDVLSIYLQDVGVRLGRKLDKIAFDVLINGDQADGSTAAPTIGVNSTTDGFTYFDLLRAWLRMGRIGRTPSRIVSNENPALAIMNLPEFKGFAGQTTVPQTLILESPIPSVQRYSITGHMPVDNQIMLIDTSAALIKFNATALKVEGERIVERGLDAVYVNLITGFANLFRDSRLLIDKSVAYGTAPFPTWMDASAIEAAG